MKEKVSSRTGKKKLVYKPTKLNPDAVAVIDKKVEKEEYASFNAAINEAVNEKFLPKGNK